LVRRRTGQVLGRIGFDEKGDVTGYHTFCLVRLERRRRFAPLK